MKVQAKNVIENYIQCFAPLNTDEEDVKDEFFEHIHDTLADIPSTNTADISIGRFQRKSGE